ncbi:MAG: hypothetical protein FWH22_11105 [Fibromonadales bacterium]|nr:hypothetical protein [Fibromonadales bacterium]
MMQEQNNNKPKPHPEITEEGCKTIKTIFRKYNNIKDDVLESITSLVRQGIDENTIIQTVGI